MIIAIDYDNTYAADPNTFNQIIEILKAARHTVICVTGRSPMMGQPVLDSVGKLIPVIFAGSEWKRVAAQQRGYKVDVWIDDMPEMVGPTNLIK